MEIGGGSLAGLARLRCFKRRRFSSWDRTGGNADALQIAAGEKAILGEAKGAGCVLNVDVFERQVNDWYGEGDDMIFIDGEPWPPRLHGTGTEDYFNTAFCPAQEFSAPYHGITLYSGDEAWPWGSKNSMYRFLIEDPIRIDESIRVTIETGHANALANDYSSTTYWYQVGRSGPLPPLAPVAQRIPRP